MSEQKNSPTPEQDYKYYTDQIQWTEDGLLRIYQAQLNALGVRDIRRIASLKKYGRLITSTIYQTCNTAAKQFKLPVFPPDFTITFEDTPQRASYATNNKIAFDFSMLLYIANHLDEEPLHMLAALKGVAAHEMYHLYQYRRFPKLMEKTRGKYYYNSLRERGANLYERQYLLTQPDRTLMDWYYAQIQLTLRYHWQMFRERRKKDLGAKGQKDA